MEQPGCGQASPFLKKGKKKQAKDELDRQKQAEKKRRRLEKALANSAAIRSELEKKKEEQQRLDEEGAAIAEAVALQVLGGEDIEESHHFMLDNNRRYCNDPNYNSGNIGLLMGYQGFGKYSIGGVEWPNDAYRSMPNEARSPFYEANYWQGSEISAEIMAAQAIKSLQIAEDPCHGGAAVVFNRMIGNSNIGGVNFYKEI